MTRNDCSNVKVFRRICGDAGLSKVVLATTRWDICPPETGAKREKELIENFWTNLLGNPETGKGKAKMMRLRTNDDSASALDIVLEILGMVEAAELDSGILSLQEQLMAKGKKFQQTDAAVELRKKLLDLLKESGSASSANRRERLRSLMQQVGDLKIPLGTRIKAMLRMVGVQS
jgi:hypothetical protein